jgi:hypothetical protein
MLSHGENHPKSTHQKIPQTGQKWPFSANFGHFWLKTAILISRNFAHPGIFPLQTKVR